MNLPIVVAIFALEAEISYEPGTLTITEQDKRTHSQFQRALLQLPIHVNVREQNHCPHVERRAFQNSIEAGLYGRASRTRQLYPWSKGLDVSRKIPLASHSPLR